MQSPILLVANGDFQNLDWLRSQLSRERTALIGVDGGANQIIQLNILPDIVLGDFDSVLPDHIKHLEDNWVNIFRFEPHKDETDLELSLIYIAENPQWQTCPVEIFGAMGGRFDHELALSLIHI